MRKRVFINLIIAGSRNFSDYDLLETEVLLFLKKYKKKGEKVSIISGRARGADKLGEQFADKFKIGKILMPADWEKYGRSAGHVRNKEMGDIATHCIVFWNKISNGSRNMVEVALKKGLELRVVDIK